MTTETFEPAPSYVIANAGPYAIPFEYEGGSEIVATVTKDDLELSLVVDTHFTVDPDARATGGELTLTDTAAASFAGWVLRIGRATLIEQGWAAQGGARERGLEAQLDRQARAIQDVARGLALLALDVGRALRVPPSTGAVNHFDRDTWAGRLVGIGNDGKPTPLELAPLSVSPGNRIISYAREIEFLTPEPEVEWLEALGHWAPGDGGRALYARVDDEPDHPGKFQTADGGWWELRSQIIVPEMLGAIGDGLTDDADAINDAVLVRNRVQLLGVYGVASPIHLGRFTNLIGPGMMEDGLRLVASGACLLAGEDGNSGYGLTVQDLLVDGMGIASKCIVLGDGITQAIGIQNVRVRDYEDVGVEIGANSDQLTLDRLNVTGARNCSPTGWAVTHKGPGPIYAVNCELSSGRGGGIYSQAHCTLVNTRVNFFATGLIRFEPPTKNNFMNLVGVFIENCGNVHKDDPVPAGSPVAILCDGLLDPSGTTSGGIIIEAPQKMQAAWASTFAKAANGGCIIFDARMPWQGNDGNRDLEAMEVAGTGSGSFIEAQRGPWRYDDWSKVQTIGRFDPQTVGPPFRFDPRYADLLWEADFSTTAGWSVPGTVSGLAVGPDGQSLVWTCAGTGASIYRDLPASVVEGYAGRPLFLLSKFTHTGSGEVFVNTRLSKPPAPTPPAPDPGAILSKMAAAQSWQGSVYGFNKTSFHCFPAFLDAAGTLRVSGGHDSGMTASTAGITWHSAELWALG
ncbi:hypothetical protein [Albimonas pacifica]|uniref:Uncharacterized protein n=1 Tax=Albimonas pacifica TaxID=1114924 RepID=A0A1I3JL92_9RHOB|nr:hypothetical protein [Albimonas pacifica]SFI61032.1 hypothetical protein SAMN05216258_10856 [Albimonas pacifica]